MRRQFITRWADWTLSARENLVQQERPKHRANASTAHNLHQTCHCVWLALSVWDPTEASAYGADPPCVCQTEHSFKALINGLSMAMLLCPCISVSLNKSEQWENVSAHTKCQITNHEKKDVLDAYTLITIRKRTNTDTDSTWYTFRKGSEMDGKAYLWTNKNKQTSADLLTGWAGLAFPTLCIKAFQILWQKIVCQESLFWLTYKLVNWST